MPREPTWNRPRDTVLRVVAAFLGSLVPSTLLCVLLARVLPLTGEVATTVGVLLLFPTWVMAMLVVLVQRSARRAWLGCLLISLALAAPVWLLGPMP